MCGGLGGGVERREAVVGGVVVVGAEGGRGVVCGGDGGDGGRCGTGCALFRIRAYSADVEYKKDVVPDADRVCFMTKG